MRPPSGELNSLGSVAYLELKKKKKYKHVVISWPTVSKTLVFPPSNLFLVKHYS